MKRRPDTAAAWRRIEQAAASVRKQAPGRYTPEARWRNIRAVVDAIRRAGRPLIVSEIATYARMNIETATTVVRAAVKLDVLWIRPNARSTRTGLAKQYDIRRRPAELIATPRPLIAPMALPDSTAQVCEALDRYMAWSASGQPMPTEDRDRMLYAAIDAALRAMPATHAIAVMHVHRLSVWTFRRVDLESVYREALDRLALRIEPLLQRERVTA
jgi:hypothetical protein